MLERRVAFTQYVQRVSMDVTREPLYAGGGQDKFFLKEESGKTYIERPYSARYIRNREALIEAGISVVPEILINPMRNFMILSDLKADGSELYGKALMYLGKDQFRNRHRPRPKIDEIFLDLMRPNEIEKIESAAQSVVQKAIKKGIELPSDDPMELLIHPDGTWEMVCLDLERGSLGEYANPWKNKRYKDQFLYHLHLLNGFLVQPED